MDRLFLGSLLLCGLGCGDDGAQMQRDAAQPDARPPDARADASTDGSGHDGGTGDYTSPDGFDRTGCTLSGWDQLALDGTVWTIAEQPASDLWPGVVRFDGSGGALMARYRGAPADRTIVTASELFFYRAPVERDALRSLLACTRPAPGQIDGKLAACDSGGSCQLGTFHAAKVERRPGETESSPGVTKLAELGSFPGADPSGLNLTVNVRVDAARKLAVLARYQDGLRILRLDPGPPYVITALGHAAVEDVAGFEIYNDVKLLDRNGRNYALAASSSHGLVIWDITDPAAPLIRSHVRNGDNVHTVFLVGTMAYLMDLMQGGLIIADLSSPEQPLERGQFVLAQGGGDVFPHDLYVEATPARAYLDYWGAGLVIVDVANPAAPVELGQYSYPRATNHSVWVTTIGGRKIALTGDEDFGAHARELDVTDAASIRLIGEWGQDRPQVSIHNILCEGDKAYVAWYQDGLRILQLSDTSAPTLLDYFNSWSPSVPGAGGIFFEGALGIDKIGTTVYLADDVRGLIVLAVP